MVRLPPLARRWLARLAAGATMMAGLSWLRHRSSQLAHSTAASAPDAATLGYEPRDMNARSIGWVLASMLATAAVLVGFVFLMVGLLQQGDTARYAGLTYEQTAPIVPPAPHLQVHPFRDLRQLRAREDARLHGYAWLDAAHTHARIPIEHAMALEVGRGLDQQP